MPIIPNAQSELLREPKLLIPGEKPVGPVKVNWTHQNAEGLLHWWPLLERGGLDIHDVANDAKTTYSTTNGSMPRWEGKEGRYCIRFVRAWADHFILSSFDAPPRTTIMFWFYPQSLPSTTRFGSHDAYELRFLSANDVQNQLYHSGDAGLVDTDRVFTGSWQHFACTGDLNAETNTTSIDGIPASSGVSADDDPGTADLWIGGRTGTVDYMDGWIDNIMIFEKVLSPGVIQSLYLDPYQLLIPA